MKYLTPWEGKKFLSLAPSARGKEIYTFPWGEVFHTFPSNWSGKVHTQAKYSVRTCTYVRFDEN